MNSNFIKEKYNAYDIVSYDNLIKCLSDGYGDPGNVQIATLDSIGWYPVGFCTKAKNGVYDCDQTQVFKKSDYRKTWIAVCSEGIDGWEAAYVGQAYLLDM